MSEAHSRVSGRELAEHFHREAVRPILAELLPPGSWAAARLGSGSDVLGLDDAVSQDHDWGCRLTVVLTAPRAGSVDRIDEALERALPGSFSGRPVRFATTWDPQVRHRVEVVTASDLAVSRLGLDPTRGLQPADWLVLTGQSVLEVTAGPIFEDSPGVLAPLHAALRWYPHDVWLYVLASGWSRLTQEMPFVGRAADVGDDIGSHVLSARLVRDVMHLAFLLERRWPPYAKWLGTAFRDLPLGPPLAPTLEEALSPGGWRLREAGLATALDQLRERQRELGLPVAAEAVIPFHDRPYRTANPEMATALVAAITDPEVTALPVGLGSVEQWSDNVDLLTSPVRRMLARGLYYG